ncbi:hypothetical protein FRC05_010209 [Tulasnella sp. 425]|nr:hypothetical protein FRC05_010209 [Tulasnella sp. 425]
MTTDVLSANYVALGAASLITGLLVKRWITRKDLPHPPGPAGLPLIGNILDMPTSKFVLTYSKWGEKYGPLTWCIVPGQTILIINAFEEAKEILEKRGTIYGDRPRLVMVGELVGMAESTPLIPYGPMWRTHRKLLKQALSPEVVQRDYSDLLTRKSLEYVKKVFDSPEAFLFSLKRTLGEIITEISYGQYKDAEGHDYVEMHETLITILKKTFMGYLVDLVPSMKKIPDWFPGAQFKRDGKLWNQQINDTRTFMYESLKRQLAESPSTVRPSFTSKLLSELQSNSQASPEEIAHEEEAISWSSFSLYQAGADATESVLGAFILAMSLFPGVQAKAQEEICRVLDGRIPTIEDYDKMPYLQAVTLEALRWNPPGPSGVPHRLTQDDMYNGYFIPQGTTVIANLWQMSRDPSYYPEPSTFYPERHITKVGGSAGYLDPREWGFGFGRRVCPGRDLAWQTLWTMIVTLLWAFEMERPEGLPFIERDEDRFDHGFGSAPVPFCCNFQPTSNDIQSKVEQYLAQAY